MERVRILRPSEFRTTVDLRDVPLSEAILRVLHPLGLTGVRADGALKDRKVTLSLVGAPFWETVGRLEKAAHVKFLSTEGLVSDEGADARDMCGNEVGRILVQGWGSKSMGGVTEHCISSTVWTSPGTWISSCRMDKVEVVSASGKMLLSRYDDHLNCRRNEGSFSKADLGWVCLASKEFVGHKQVVIRGTVILGFPRDIQRHAPGKLLSRVEFEEGYIELSQLKRMERGDWAVGLGAMRNGGRFSVLMSVADAEGRWLGDLPGLTLEPGSSMGMSTSVTLREGVPARLVVLRALAEDEMQLPFSFQVPVPD